MIRGMLVCVAVSILLLSCRQRDSAKSVDLSPVLVSKTSKARVLTADVDKSGLSLAGNPQIIVVDLAYFPPRSAEQGDRAILPLCLSTFSDDAEIGEISCAKGKSPQLKLKASQVRQTCSANANTEAFTGPSQPIPTLKGCDTVQIRVYEFDPQIQARMKEVVQR